MRPNEAAMEAPKPTLAAVLEKENLNRAWEAVRANKGAPGPDGRDIASSQAHMRENWENIEAKLRSGEYNPGPVRAVTIPKPNGGERTLGVPNVQDRLIQQAIHAKLSESGANRSSVNTATASARCGAHTMRSARHRSSSSRAKGMWWTSI